MKVQTILVDGAMRSKDDLAHLLMVLDPQSDSALWNSLYRKWLRLERQSRRRRRRRAR
jgi:hypothetical protein